MPKWGNKNLVAYHGTVDLSLGSIPLQEGKSITLPVNLALCRPFTDFAQGFYVTTSEYQARQWANAQVLRSLAPKGSSPNAVVLAFNLGRDWLASLEALIFVRPTNDFWDLVDDCRNGFPPHQRQPRAAQPNSCYDVVYGPVALGVDPLPRGGFNIRRLVIQDCDQISFHTQSAVRGLGSPTIHAIAVPPVEGDPGLFSP